MIIEKTTTTKIGKDTYTNNLETRKITKNKQTILPYCVIARNDNILTIQQGNMITTIGLQDNPHKEILKQLLQQDKKTKPSKKTSKTTIKGKQDNKKGDK